MKYVVTIAALLLSACGTAPVPDSVQLKPSMSVGNTWGKAIATWGEALPAEAAPVDVMSNPHVFYDTDLAVLSDYSKTYLNRLVSFMGAHPGILVQVIGSCDERGSDAHNVALGTKRARGVVDYLVGQGVSPNRIAVESVGKSKPASLCHDESCWRWNRRADVVIVQIKG